MNFVGLGQHFVRLNNNVSSNSSVSPIHPSVLDAVIPGWSLISRFLYDVFGFDVSLIVSFCAICLGLVKGFSFLWAHLVANFESYCMSSIHIDNGDDLFNIALKWLADKQMSQTAASVRARTQTGSACDEDVDEQKAADTSIDDGGHFNYGKWQARVPPIYEPHYGRNSFWHKGNFFRFNRKLKPQQSVWSSGDEDEIEISCVGWSTHPVKRLLQEMKIWSIEAEMSRTSIRHATSKSMRGGMRWSITNSRPSRPINTVILDENQKSTIIQDMNEFLHPSSPKWYATRGIPYRRGYLFHGPPGTGKTSLTFALAGIFGLDLYCFSLNDPELTEGDLRDLFNWLPRRCIVLLEDIDEAGIKRPDHKDGTSSSDSTKKSEKDEAGKVSRRMDAAKKDAGISLSGLLNAIDGVATHEGRVLIMTTNHPEALDEALVRTGRVDLRIKFDYASTHQIRELFLRMYAVDVNPFGRVEGLQLSSQQTLDKKAPAAAMGKDDAMLILERTAAAFAEKVPNREFSPSDIQGYLLLHKKTPLAALDGVETWIAEERKKKAEKKSKAEKEKTEKKK
ncbi:hypothetical protein ANO11243_032680 [Dothideomycetidae sp. 11243]|nr:hypothetical protein ANO11243_032680 [fungal sp. No.11243]